MLRTVCLQRTACAAGRGFSSIFDVIRERRSELSNQESGNASTTATTAAVDSPSPPGPRESQSPECNVTALWKQFNIQRSKPRGYRDLWQLRHLGVRTLQVLPIASPEELSHIAEVLAYAKYRNVVLLQGMNEALYWHCKLKKCKLSHIASFLRSCATLKFTPSYRYLQAYFAELDSLQHKSTVGDYLRILQFLVETGLTQGGPLTDLYDRCYSHCLNNMGYMNHHSLSSFSQTQLLVDNTDRNVFDRIWNNFERNIKESSREHFFMLANSLLRTQLNDIPISCSRVTLHYLDHHDQWDPKLVNTVLGLLHKYYHRDTVILSKIGNKIAGNLASFSHDQVFVAMNHYAALSYKHKELLHALGNSNLLETNDNCKKLQVLAGMTNLLAKVQYKHIELLKKITDTCVNCLKTLNGSSQLCNGIPAAAGPDNAKMTTTVIPWMVQEPMKGNDRKHRKDADTEKTVIITNAMILDSIGPAEAKPKETAKRQPTSLRRLIIKSESESEHQESKLLEIGKLKVVPVSVDILRRQTLQECLEDFYNEHFEGRHPARRRLEMRRRMEKQERKLRLRRNFDRSRFLATVHLEKHQRLHINRSVRKVKQKMRYSGSRYVQSTQHYINECRVLKRCFLRPYKTVTDNMQSEHSDAMVTIHQDTRQQWLSSLWKKHSQHCLSRSALCSSPLEQAEPSNLPSVAPTDTVPKLPLGEHREAEQTLVDGNRESDPPQIRRLANKLLHHLDNYIDNRSPVVVDNALIFTPVKVSSLYSRRLKRKLLALQQGHSQNELHEVIKYNLDNGLWTKHQEANETQYIQKEQPLWQYTFEIVSALHRLNFTSFELLDQVTRTLQLAEPIAVTFQDHDQTMASSTYVAISRIAKGLNHMISAIGPILSRDASRVLTSRLLNSICSSGMFTSLEKSALASGQRVPLTDIVSYFRMFNKLLCLRFHFSRQKHGQDNIVQEDNRDLQSIAIALDSLKSLATMSVSNPGIRKTETRKLARDLIELLDESLYGQYILYSLEHTAVPNNRATTSKGTGRIQDYYATVVNSLMQCLEQGTEKETALDGIRSIRRYISAVEDTETRSLNHNDCVTVMSEPVIDTDGNYRQWKPRIEALMERHQITEDITVGLHVSHCNKELFSPVLAGRPRGLDTGVVQDPSVAP